MGKSRLATREVTTSSSMLRLLSQTSSQENSSLVSRTLAKLSMKFQMLFPLAKECKMTSQRSRLMLHNSRM